MPGAAGKVLAFPGGYTVSIGAVQSRPSDDGARTAGSDSGFETIGAVTWSLARDGKRVDGGAGHTVYRDSRAGIGKGTGAIRLMCEAIDYRFARYRSGDSQMIHPLISRGVLRDVQIWLPAALPVNGDLSKPRQVPVIVKVFPLMSLVWAGLTLCLLGAAWQTARQFTRSGEPSRNGAG